ncbi:MAG: MBL fold metallo-hydrolase [Rubrobacter sp.]
MSKKSRARHTKTITAPNPGPLTLDGTNTYIFGNVVIDPGPDNPEHLERVASKSNVEIILLTHRHSDHASGASRLSEMTDAPVLAFGSSISSDEEVAGLLALHTPGHARDHLCFWDARSKTLFSGDLIAGRGSIMVAPPEGDMRDYMDSLYRVKNLSPERILPGHGPEITEAKAKIEEYIRHREEREAMIVSALDSGAKSLEDVLESAYSDTPKEMFPYAEMALRAHLIKLGRSELL